MNWRLNCLNQVSESGFNTFSNDGVKKPVLSKLFGRCSDSLMQIFRLPRVQLLFHWRPKRVLNKISGKFDNISRR